jgi:hypothetical protein
MAKRNIFQKNPDVVHDLDNADFSNYVYTQILSSETKVVTINGQNVQLFTGKPLPIRITRITRTSNIVLFGYKTITPFDLGEDTKIDESLIPNYVVSLIANPPESGTLSGNGTFQSGSTVNISATPNSGFTFNNWSINSNTVSTDNPYSFSLTGDTSLVGNFNPEGLKILLLGDSNLSTVQTQLNNEMTSLGYTSTISTRSLGTTYTGGDIAEGNYNVIDWTNSGQVGTTQLDDNLLTFVNSGGSLVTGTFVWNLRPTGFDLTNLTCFASTNQSSNNGNMTITTPHPITDTLASTSITAGQLTLNNGNPALNANCTRIATYTTGGGNYVAIRELPSGGRLVSLNIYFASSMATRANLRRLVTNSVLWAGKKI